jgi:hypothetical protein
MKHVISTWNIPGPSAREHSFLSLMQAIQYRWPHLDQAQRWQREGHWYLTLEEAWDLEGDVLTIEAVAYCDRQTIMVWDILTA